MVGGVSVIIVAGDSIAVGVAVSVPVARGKVVGVELQLISHRENTNNIETTFSAIVTNVKPLPFLTKIQAGFLRDHGYRLPWTPILL